MTFRLAGCCGSKIALLMLGVREDRRTTRFMQDELLASASPSSPVEEYPPYPLT